MRTLILGGARSGKSAHAERLAAGSVYYLATGEPRPDDADWTARVDEHRRRRPADWTTVESDPIEFLHSSTLDSADTVILDDLGTWLTGELDGRSAWDGPRGAVADRVDGLAGAITRCPARLLIVSPEVGLGVIPPTAAGRLFRDELGALNARIAQLCDEVVLVVAGIPLPVKAGGAENGAENDAGESADSPAATPPAKKAPAEAAVAAGAVAAATIGEATEVTTAVVDAAAVDFPTVAPPDPAVRDAALERQRRLTKPAGALGRLEELSVWASACQGVCPPHDFAAPRVVVFAGDHGVAQSGVSAYPSEVTGQMVANIVGGGAAVNALATIAGAGIRIADISVDAPTPTHVQDHKIRRSSGSIDREDALTDEEVRAAIAAGRAIADEEVDSGADLLIAGEMGIGNTTPATVLIAAITGTEPVVAVGRGTGIDDAGWMRKTAAVRDALRRARPVVGDPVELLRRVAGADLAAMAGFLAQAAIRRTPVILDGLVVTAAAVAAQTLAPGASAWWTAGHRSAEPAHSLALHRLGLTPILELDMRLGEGSGALVALPVLRGAVATLTQMATFEDAGVTTPDDAP